MRVLCKWKGCPEIASLLDFTKFEQRKHVIYNEIQKKAN